MSAHTPGPWSVGNSRTSGADSKLGAMWEAAVHVGSEANRGNSLASVHMGGLGALYSTREAVEANARLIAAAPDLAYMLTQLAQYCEATGNPSALDWARSARDVLTKAGL